MGLKKKVTISWSGGKDAAFALYKILSSGEYEVVNLHTVMDEETKRVGLHGVSETWIEKQAESIGLPLIKIYLRSSPDHDTYERLMKSFYRQCARQDIEGVVFGDIFLEDLRQYRVQLLKDSGLTPIFPLWDIETPILLGDVVRAGFKARICSANASMFKEAELGKTIDLSFSESLMPGVDVCGENGEYHTFVYDGPIMKKPVRIKPGEIVKKFYTYQRKNMDGKIERIETAFWFQDLLPCIA